jgi:hypothetical protein
LADNKEVCDSAFKDVIPVISQQELCDPRRPHLFHILPHPACIIAYRGKENGIIAQRLMQQPKKLQKV